ncbi:hypothetical protein V8E36_004187 [Tilletia maclaganii]
MVSSDQLGLDEKVEDVRTQADMGASTLLLSQTAVSSRGFPSTILRTRRTTAKRTPNAYKRGDEEDLNRSPNTKTTATTLSSVAPSEAEDDDVCNESEDEMIVTRQDVDVLEFTKTPKSSYGGVPGAGGRPPYDSRASSGAASSYFHLPQAQHTPGGSLPGRTPLTRPFLSISSALEFGMTPLRAFPQAERSLDPDQPGSTSGGGQAHPPISVKEDENETPANTSEDDSQIRTRRAVEHLGARPGQDDQMGLAHGHQR